jgi:hypothetical protein
MALRRSAPTGGLVVWAIVIAALAGGAALVPSTANGATASVAAPVGKALSVNLADTTGKATGVGLGILYGLNEDASLPVDQYLKPLNLNSFRGGGWFSGGWIGDNYQFGPDMQADITSIIDQARRLRSLFGRGFQYQVLLSDLYGANAHEPANTQWPCANGDCSNYVTFLKASIEALKASGINFAFDIWNEPEFSFFWGPGVNTPQYFEMWDTAYREIRTLDPKATIVGPSFAFTPLSRPQEWQTWFQHVTSTNTVPDLISNHDEGDVDDPVTVGNAIEAAAASAGLGHVRLSANEYQPADRQTAGVTAWYLDRFAQSGYTNAMRGNWACCEIPNETQLLAQTATGWAPTGNWWAMRTYADFTGDLVAPPNETGATTISAAEDKPAKRVVALIGDSEGYTGTASVTFNGISSMPWLTRQNMLHVTVYRIPDRAPLYAPGVVYDQTVNASSGSVTIPFTFQSAHDAFAVYLSWDDPQVVSLSTPNVLSAPGTYQVPVTFTNGSAVTDRKVQTTLSVSAAKASDANQLTIHCLNSDSPTCPAINSLPPGQSVTTVYVVNVAATVPAVGYRLTATTNLTRPGGNMTAQNSADVIVPCGLGDICEAETGNLTGGACVAGDHPGFTGSGFVACMTFLGPGVSQQFHAPTAGSYTLDVRYGAGPNGPNQTRTATISVDGTSQGQIQLPLTGSWDTWGDATTTVQLPAGTSMIELSVGASDTGWYNIDHFVLSSNPSG